MRTDHLPTLTITRVQPDRAIGSFHSSIWIGEGHIGYLLRPDERLVRGRFVDIDLVNRTATFVPDDPADMPSLSPATTYPRVDGYWGERVALVLDRRRHWRRRTFTPTDAVAFHSPDGTLLGQPSADNLAAGGTIIKGGWDHEHCNICWAKISSHTSAIAMFSDPDHSLCLDCYDRFVVPQSLEFVGVA